MKTVNTAEEAVAIAKDLITDKYKEHFIALYLNPLNQLNKSELVSLGSINTCFSPSFACFSSCYNFSFHFHFGITQSSK